MGYLTIKAAAALESVDISTTKRKLAANRYPETKLSDTIAKNGKRPVLIHVNSLSITAQIKFYRSEDKKNATPDSRLTKASEKSLEVGLRRLKIVKEALALKERHIQSRNKKEGLVIALSALAESADTSYQSLNRWMRDFRRGGFARLLPRVGTPRKSRFDDEILQAIQSEYLSLNRPSQADVFEAIKLYCIENLMPAPSYKTVQRIISQIPAAVARLHRMGEKDWLSKSAPKAQRDMSLIAVNDCWNSDHREFDLFLDLGKKVQRPWLTSWFDMASRKVVGYSINFAPNSQSIALSFRAGIKTHGRPKGVYLDNGKDYVSHYLNGKNRANRKNRKQSVCNEGVFGLLGCKVTNAIPYAAWSKPIERWHDNIRRFERSLPGWCGSDNKERPEKLMAEIESRKLLTLKEFSHLFEEWISEYNNRVHSALEGKTPAEMYENVHKEIPTDRALDLLLMKTVPKKVHSRGVGIFPNHYHYAKALGPYIGDWVTVRYDPEEAGKVYIFLNGGTKFLCTAIERKILSMGAAEADLKAVGKEKSEAKKAIKAHKKDLHMIHHDDTHLAAYMAAKEGKGYLAATTSEAKKPEGKVLRFVSKLDAAAKQISEDKRANPTPDLSPEPEATDPYAIENLYESLEGEFLEKLRLEKLEEEKQDAERQRQFEQLYQ